MKKLIPILLFLIGCGAQQMPYDAPEENNHCEDKELRDMVDDFRMHCQENPNLDKAHRRQVCFTVKYYEEACQ